MEIKIPPTYNNEVAHQQLKQLMEQKEILSIRLENEPCAWIGTHKITGLRYMLNMDSWKWIVNYLKTGSPDDFRVLPSIREAIPDFSVMALKELVDTRCEVHRIPFLRETQPSINFVTTFKFGKIYIRIKRTDPIIEYFNAHKR